MNLNQLTQHYADEVAGGRTLSLDTLILWKLLHAGATIYDDGACLTEKEHARVLELIQEDDEQP